MRKPTITHRYPPKYVIQWIVFIIFVVILLWAVLASAQGQVDVPACRRTNYPKVCAESYHKCNNIGLNEACLEVAKLDGYYGCDIMKCGMSHNMKTGDKPVYSGEN